MFGLRFRDQLPGVVLDEFENLIAGLKTFLLKEHNEDGTHLVTVPGTNFVPTGGMITWPTATPPTNWLICDGSQIDRLTYKTLFETIGTLYGAGNGTTTFNIPDLRQRFVLGVAASGTGSTLAGTGGSIDHAHSGGSLSGSTGATAPGTDSQGNHSHTATTSSDGAHSHSQGAHSHAISSVGAGDESIVVGDLIERAAATQVDINNDAGTSTNGDHTHSLTTSTDGAHTHTVASHTHGAGTLAVGTSGTSNPAFIALHWIIKV